MLPRCKSYARYAHAGHTERHLHVYERGFGLSHILRLPFSRAGIYCIGSKSRVPFPFRFGKEGGSAPSAVGYSVIKGRALMVVFIQNDVRPVGSRGQV